MKYSKYKYKFKVEENFSIELPFKIPYFVHPYASLKDGILSVKRGYAWDGASGPIINTRDTLVAIFVHDVLYHEFYRTVLSTMNRWTTFCISMTEGIALENLLFKCMGKNFIEFFTVTYGFIANLNVNTNAITKK